MAAWLFFVVICFCKVEDVAGQGVQVLNGAGAAFGLPVYEKWWIRYATMVPVTTVYKPVGSYFGKRWLRGEPLANHEIGEPIVFAGSDYALTEKDYKEFPHLQMIPMIAGALVLVFNVPGIHHVRLARETLPAIYFGDIQWWDDPELQKQNLHTILPHQRIYPLARRDEAGVTETLTKSLSTFDPDWANGPVLQESSRSAEPYLGSEVSEKQRFVKTIRYSRSIFGSKRDRSFTVTFEDFAVPTLNLQIKLYQKISVVAHAFASYLENFVAQICLDKNSNRYLNITLIKSYGESNIEVYRDRQKQDMDLILSLSTNLPLATNYSEILPLPGFVASSRLVCISASNKPSNRLCIKWATFQREPVQWFILKNNFLETQGSCPGCNKETSLGGFLSNLNPKNWFNGINSFSEGIAMALEIFLYVILLIVLIGVWRRCLWPVLKWTVCNKGPKKYEIVTKKPAEV